MRYLLNVCYVLLLVTLSPWLVYSAIRRGKYREGLGQKLFGFVPKLAVANSNEQPTPESNAEGRPYRIWFHAVSVGEVNLLATLLPKFQKQRPSAEIVISTTTKTGFKLATDRYPQNCVFYCPLDFSWAVGNAFRRLEPSLLVLVELELWPNLLMEAKRRNVPVAIVNGRLSDKSTRGYLRLGSWMRNLLMAVRVVAAQSQPCADRFVQLGVPSKCVHAVGSVKFDGAETDRQNSRTLELKNAAGIGEDDLIFLAGSTQDPEEALAIETYQLLRPDHPQLRLILVPRHPERSNEVARQLDTAGVDWIRRSQIGTARTYQSNNLSGRSTTESAFSKSPEVILVDTVGELGAWWGCADIGFVGGSMGSRGGQNMLEPAGFGVATCFGPETKNFRDVVRMLLETNGAVVVNDGNELTKFVQECASSAQFRQNLGHRAKQLVTSQRGAADSTVNLLLQFVPDTASKPRVIESKSDREAA